MAKSKFIKISCPKCDNECIIFGRASTEVKCSNCNYLLNKSKGGKAKFRAKITKILWR